jgi:hypothetical protein
LVLVQVTASVHTAYSEVEGVRAGPVMLHGFPQELFGQGQIAGQHGQRAAEPQRPRHARAVTELGEEIAAPLGQTTSFLDPTLLPAYEREVVQRLRQVSGVAVLLCPRGDTLHTHTADREQSRF